MCNTDVNLVSFCFSPLYCHWNHFFKFLHCRWILYQPSYQEALYCSHRLINISIDKQFMQGERWRSSPYFILVGGISGWPSLSGDQMELLSCHRPAASASPGNLLEVQLLRPHSRFTGSLFWRCSAIRALHVLQVTLKHLKVSVSSS